MKTIFTILFLQIVLSLQAQTIFGRWKTIDDETGEPRSIVEVFERNGKVYGKVVKLLLKPTEDQDPVCLECDKDDPRYKQKVLGMEIMKDLVRDDDEYAGGEILDPNNGKVYRCKIWLEGKDLKLRGYLGPFYRTQTWVREK